MSDPIAQPTDTHQYKSAYDGILWAVSSFLLSILVSFVLLGIIAVSLPSIHGSLGMGLWGC